MSERTFVLPDLGEGLEEAEIAAWLVQEGDEVALNQPIAEIETAKATVEIPSPFVGRVAKLHAAAGSTLAVGSALVTFEVGDAETDPPPAGGPTTGAAPAVGSGATPAVRKLAKELGVELGSVAGTGPQGRVTREDVERASAGSPPDAGDAEVVPVSMIRRAIAANLTKAAAVPTVTTFRTVDCTELDAFRRELDVSPLPIVVRALVETCRAHPMMNAEWREDGIRVHARVHVGIAVDTERGLIVPAVRDAGELGVGALAAEIGRLAAAARAGSLPSDAGAGTTISVSNTGSYGSEYGTPLLNPPNAVTIALGAIAPRALVVDGSVEARPACTISCTFDHRVLDGADAGRALSDLVALLEDPERLRTLPR